MPAMRQEHVYTMPQPVLNTRALKCTIVLDPAKVAQIVAPDGKPRTVIAIRLPELDAKSVRKTLLRRRFLPSEAAWAVRAIGPVGDPLRHGGRRFRKLDSGQDASASRRRRHRRRSRSFRHKRGQRARTDQ